MIKIQPCLCGCGETPEFDNYYRQRKFVEGHNKGKVHQNWKGGRIRHSNGYILILLPDYPFCDSRGYVMEHRLVMEEYLGRYLTDDEHIHHINGIKIDNRIENLQILTPSEHNKLHRPVVDKSNRFCFQCRSATTSRNKYRNYEPRWFRHPITNQAWICSHCYNEIYNRRMKK